MGKKKWTVKRIIKTIWVLFGIAFTIWMFYSYQSKGVSDFYIQDDEKTTVEVTDDFYRFKPKEDTKFVMLFYPGAMVEPKAYVPLCRKISEANIEVYLIRMPWRLATKGYNKPKELGLFEDSSKIYILSGHSQGAKMAAQFTYENPQLVDKLVLIGTTHPRDISLANSKIPILKIYGGKDGVADENTILENRNNLPSNAKLMKIEGANHAQFGYYGYQLGDSSASISREEQQKQTVELITDFIISDF